MTDFKDQFTLDGRLKPAHPSVTRSKVAEADRLLSAALRGDRIAAGQLAEVHTTSDLPFALAHLVSATAIPQFDQIERTWSQIADVRTVSTFNNVRLYSLLNDLSGAGVAEGADAQGLTGGLPDVPEAAPYPYVTISGKEAFYAKVTKKGAKFGFTWESQINDVEGFYGNLPSDLVNLALDTEEREVYQAVISGVTTTLAGGTLPDGTAVVANAPISPNAIWQAIIELSNKTVNGRKVGRSPRGYNVLVPVGVKDFIDWSLNQAIISIQDGSITFGPGDRSALNGVTVIESPYITGTNWYILAKPGSFNRPFIELGRLRGYEAPELRANGNTGVYLGSSAVVPFNQGSWDNDTIDYRVRYVCGGIVWSGVYGLHSEGDGN